MKKDYRYEIKFVLDAASTSKLHIWMNSKTMMRKAFPNRQVNSLYFDDINFSSVKDNLMGISDREKFRLRWYGDNSSDDKVLFEIKRRHGRLGFKESYEVNSIKGLLNDLNLNELFQMSMQDLYANNVVLDKNIHPSLQVSYDREYYSDNEGIRLTVDNNIRFYNPCLYQKLSSNLETPYPLTILEIKFLPDLKPQAASIIQSLDLTPKRHSKYLTGMAAMGLATYI